MFPMQIFFQKKMLNDVNDLFTNKNNLFKFLELKKKEKLIKMFNKFVLFSFLLAFKLIESIKSTDICYIKKREWIENYNSKCDNICNGKYNYKCGTETCSINKLKCQEHQILLRLIKLFNETNNFKSEIEVFKSFTHNITKCPYTWQSSDICLNGMSK